MKKIIIPVLLMIFYLNIFSQVPECGELKKGFDTGEEIPLDFIPATLTDDTWGTPVLETDRRVFFVHGLGGEGDEAGTVAISWSQASLWSQTLYKINAARPDYADVSLSIAAAELKEDIESMDGAGDDAIFIGHSQGGIVGRRIDYAYSTGEWGPEPRAFGGLVTFGSSHQGAKILNNKEDLLDWSGTTCIALTSGPLLEEVADHFFLDLLLTDEVAESVFEDFFCGTIENNIAPFLFKDYFSGIAESYEVGADQLEELNSFTPEIPYVCFYGIEDEPVIWNTLVHILPGHEPNNVITYGEEPFGAGNDLTLKNYADELTGKYFASYTAWNLMVDIMDVAADGIFGMFGGDLWGEAADIRDGYKEGYDWLVNANYTWRGFIGEWEFVEAGATCTCLDDGPLGDLFEDVYEASPDGECYTEDDNTDCYVTTNFDYITRRSDGVVLEESASECLGQIEETPGYDRIMEGSNHFSMRNDSNTEEKLSELYEGGHGLFFKTHLR